MKRAVQKIVRSSGGPLNALSTAHGLNLPKKSVPVMRLIKYHRPTCESELEELIARHAAPCRCGCVSTGSVQDFGHALFVAQTEWPPEDRYSEEQCVQWMRNLFVTNSLAGTLAETRAMEQLLVRLPRGWLVRYATDREDRQWRIDIMLEQRTAARPPQGTHRPTKAPPPRHPRPQAPRGQDQRVLSEPSFGPPPRAEGPSRRIGVQVKPASYAGVPEVIRHDNQRRHADALLYHIVTDPVVFVYYDNMQTLRFDFREVDTLMQSV